MCKTFDLIDFVGGMDNLTGEVVATYTMKMDNHPETCHPTWFFFRTKCGGVQVGDTYLRQGKLPLVTLKGVRSLDSARSFAGFLLGEGFKLNKAWM